MVGDSYEDDIEGARALGIRAIYLDRGPRYTSLRFAGTRTTDLTLRGDPTRMSTIVLQGDATGTAFTVEQARQIRRFTTDVTDHGG